ncbi:hypothetical protein NP569_27375, partial [Vibrio parahaemolyticus]|nr:hypothetical protein [Vibrio parahaemolyticus]
RSFTSLLGFLMSEIPGWFPDRLFTKFVIFFPFGVLQNDEPLSLSGRLEGQRSWWWEKEGNNH